MARFKSKKQILSILERRLCYFLDSRKNHKSFYFIGIVDFRGEKSFANARPESVICTNFNYFGFSPFQDTRYFQIIWYV